MNNNENRTAEDKNFKKVLLDVLTEYHATVTDDSCIYEPYYVQCGKELEVTYAEIEKLLQKKNQKLINKYDALKNEAFGYEADEMYLNGLKDAVKILKVLNVI